MVEIKLEPFRHGYIQLVTYEFTVDGKLYKGHYKGTKLTGKQKPGDSIRVMVAKNNPGISKRIKTLR